MEFLIVYQKKDGNVIYRQIRSYPILKIGDITSMGWKVLDIQYFYNNRYYTYEEYHNLLKQDIEKEKKQIIKDRKKQEIKDFFTKNRKIGGSQ